MGGKKFRFSLERVLSVRRHETECAREHLGTTSRERREQEEHVRHMQHRLAGCASAPSGRIDPVALRRQEVFRQQAQHRLDAARAELDDRRGRERQARQELRRKHGAEESLQLMRDREAVRHRKARQEAEAAFLVEQAIAGFFRKQAGVR